MALRVTATLLGMAAGLVLLTTTGSLPPLAAQPAATTFEAEQLALFARVVLEIEPHRLEAQEKSAATEDPDEREQIRRDFIRQVTDILNTLGMTVPDYNRITLAIRSNDGQALRERIEDEVRQLQTSGYQPGNLEANQGL